MSAAPKPAAGLLFQLWISPLFGLMACGWSFVFRKPRHSYRPVPSVGRLGFGAAARESEADPAEKNAMSLWST